VAKDMYDFMTMRVKGTWVLVMYYDGKGEHCHQHLILYPHVQYGTFSLTRFISCTLSLELHAINFHIFNYKHAVEWFFSGYFSYSKSS
jgi:hypothetical protein